MKYKEQYTYTEKEQIKTIGQEGSNCTVEISSNITKLPKFNFCTCENLIAINLPENVKKICESAFEDCFSLEVVIIPSVEEISSSAFYNCESLESIILPNNLEYIEDLTFGCCTNLKNIIVPDSVKHIGEYAFKNCESLERINLPNSIERLDKYSFCSCTNLKEIVIPDSVTIIENGIFTLCNNLQEVTIKAKCKLPSDMFSGCKYLEKIKITQESYNLSHDFVKKYKDEIEIIKSKTLDELLDDGKSLREISQILKVEER